MPLQKHWLVAELNFMKYEILTSMNMIKKKRRARIMVFWDVTPYILVDRY
jgi:hypothetical protein